MDCTIAKKQKNKKTKNYTRYTMESLFSIKLRVFMDTDDSIDFLNAPSSANVWWFLITIVCLLKKRTWSTV